MQNAEYIRARKSQIKFYKDIELYRAVGSSRYALYKKAGITLDDMRVGQAKHPGELYIKNSDKLKGIQAAQKGFNKQLEKDINSGNPSKIKETLVTVVEETFTEPRSGSLEGLSDTVGIIIDDYAKESEVVKNLFDISYKDHSTILHSINVMAFILGYASYMKYPQNQAKDLGLSALLHDVGKVKINKEILIAPRKLTNEEFEEMKSHTTIGYNILRKCKFGKEISLCALEHHEKLDGSGYPNSKTRISMPAQILGMIDCYEALTNDDRPYRAAMGVFDTLQKIIGNAVESGQYSKEIYSQFVKSLGGITN